MCFAGYYPACHPRSTETDHRPDPVDLVSPSQESLTKFTALGSSLGSVDSQQNSRITRADTAALPIDVAMSKERISSTFLYVCPDLSFIGSSRRCAVGRPDSRTDLNNISTSCNTLSSHHDFYYRYQIPQVPLRFSLGLCHRFCPSRGIRRSTFV